MLKTICVKWDEAGTAKIDWVAVHDVDEFFFSPRFPSVAQWAYVCRARGPTLTLTFEVGVRLPCTWPNPHSHTHL